MKKAVKIIIVVLVLLCVVAAAAVFSADAFVKAKAKESIITAEEAAKISDADCIIVLGCRPSPMLSDRLKRGAELYKTGAAPKILMSGDHGRKDYDEVNVMRKYAEDEGIDTHDIFTDHAGFSTYETMYRAKEVFGAKKVIIVTQSYHLYRAVYDAKKLGLDAVGVVSYERDYDNKQTYRDLREVAARCKDFVYCIFKPKPTYLGEVIPINGDGELSRG